MSKFINKDIFTEKYLYRINFINISWRLDQNFCIYLQRSNLHLSSNPCLSNMQRTRPAYVKCFCPYCKKELFEIWGKGNENFLSEDFHNAFPFPRDPLSRSLFFDSKRILKSEQFILIIISLLFCNCRYKCWMALRRIQPRIFISPVSPWVLLLLLLWFFPSFRLIRRLADELNIDITIRVRHDLFPFYDQELHRLRTSQSSMLENYKIR